MDHLTSKLPGRGKKAVDDDASDDDVHSPLLSPTPSTTGRISPLSSSSSSHLLEPFLEAPFQPSSIPRSITIRLYVSHFLSTWNSRVFEFGAVLFLAEIFPRTLLPMSVYALARAGAAIVAAPAVGRYIDRGDRLAVVRTSIVGQRIAVEASCVLFWILSRNGMVDSPVVRVLGTASLAMLACVEKPCAVMNLVSVERDWVVVIAGQGTGALREINAQMRRIDLFCKLVGPLMIAVISGFSMTVAIWVVFGLNFVSVFIEYFAIAEVYNRVPALHDRSQSAQEDDSTSPPPSQSHALTNLVAHGWTLISNLTIYTHNPAFLPSLSLSFLYLTVLSFAGQMVTYLLSAGYTPTAIGVVRAISTCFELSATWLAPVVMRRIGPVRGGMWFVNAQLVCLGVGVGLFCTLREPVRAASALVGGVVASRVGLWGFDLCVQVVVQEDVPANTRGTFSTVEASLQNAFELLSYLSTIIFARPDQFRVPVLISCGAVSCAGVLYAAFVRQRRGHLVHVSKCIKGRERTGDLFSPF